MHPSTPLIETGMRIPIADHDSILGLLNRVDVNVDVSEVHAASIFRVEGG
jgi:hypothetical protein